MTVLSLSLPYLRSMLNTSAGIIIIDMYKEIQATLSACRCPLAANAGRRICSVLTLARRATRQIARQTTRVSDHSLVPLAVGFSDDSFTGSAHRIAHQFRSSAALPTACLPVGSLHWQLAWWGNSTREQEKTIRPNYWKSYPRRYCVLEALFGFGLLRARFCIRRGVCRSIFSFPL